MLENKLSISDAMKSGFLLWKKHFYKIILVGLAVYIPTQILIELASEIFNNSSSVDNISELSTVNNINNVIRYLIGSIALIAILNFIVSYVENNEEKTVKQMLQTGINKWGNYIGVAFKA